MNFEYEPYHIGSKFKFYVDKAKLVSKLQNYYEEEIEEYEVNPNVFNTGSLISPVMTVLVKEADKVFIQLNLLTNALNVIGNEPTKVYDSFKILIEALPNVGYDLKSTFSFYEIISSIILNLEKEINPKKIFEKFTTSKFTSIYNISDITVSHIKFSNQFILEEGGERFELEIYPNLTNPEHSIILKILSRKHELSGIKEFHQNIDNLINDFYQKLIEE